VTWETDVLTAINAPTSANNIAKVNAWNACEGNNPLPQGSGIPINNPFNTTLNCCGGVNFGNSAGVKAYPSWSAGVQATAQTLQAGRYVQVVSNLQSDGSIQAFQSALNSSGWAGAGGYGNCIVSRAGPTSASPGPSGTNQTNQPGNVNYNYAQLEGLWIQAGGSAQQASMAAAIAMAESSGNANAIDYDSNGSVDRGLWQINSVHGAQSTFDPMGNARAAISISNNGTNWGPWTTYTSGAYQRFLQQGVAPDTTAPINATNAAGPNSTLTSDTETAGFNCPTIIGGIPGVGTMCDAIGSGLTQTFYGSIMNGVIAGVLNPVFAYVAGFMGIIGGGIIVLIGLFVIVESSKAGQAVTRTAIGAGGMAIGQPELAAAAPGRLGTVASASARGRQTRTQQFVSDGQRTTLTHGRTGGFFGLGGQQQIVTTRDVLANEAGGYVWRPTTKAAQLDAAQQQRTGRTIRHRRTVHAEDTRQREATHKQKVRHIAETKVARSTRAPRPKK
jgi:Lysozyme like domain